MKKKSCSICLLNPFFHGTIKTRNPGFGPRFRVPDLSLGTGVCVLCHTTRDFKENIITGRQPLWVNVYSCSTDVLVHHGLQCFFFLYLNYVTNGFKSSTVILSFFGLWVGGQGKKYFKTNFVQRHPGIRTNKYQVQVKVNNVIHIQKKQKEKKNV